MSRTTESLTNRTARAAQWGFAASVLGAASQLAIGVLLARLLTPADFGVVTLALTLLGFAQPLADLGVGSAIVQRSMLTDRHVRTAFTFSVLLSLGMATAIALLAPLGAGALREPRVTPVLRVLAAGLAFRGVAVVAGALLRRQLDFRSQFFISIVCFVLGYGGVGVTLALFGYGLWSLAWGFTVQTALVSLAQLIALRHSVRPLLGGPELRELLAFGFGASLSAWVNYFALHGDNLVIGRWMGAASVGLYDRAYSLMNLPHTHIGTVISRVLFPAMAQVQKEPVRLRRGYLLGTRLTATIAAPLMATMVVAAPHLVPAVYGSQWNEAVLPLQILCVAGYFRALYHLGGAVAQSVGSVYRELWRQAVYSILVIGGALVALPQGLPGVATAVSLAILCMFVATGDLALRSTNTPWRLYIHVQLGAITTAAATACVALVVRFILEAYQVAGIIITLAMLAAAAVPWSVGVLWTLGAPDFDLVRAHLPGWGLRVVSALRPRPFDERH